MAIYLAKKASFINRHARDEKREDATGPTKRKEEKNPVASTNANKDPSRCSLAAVFVLTKEKTNIQKAAAVRTVIEVE